MKSFAQLVSLLCAILAVGLVSPSFGCTPNPDFHAPTSQEIAGAVRRDLANAVFIADVRVERYDTRTGETTYRTLKALRGAAPERFLVGDFSCSNDSPIVGATYRLLFDKDSDGYRPRGIVRSGCYPDLYDKLVDSFVRSRRPASYHSIALPLPPPPRGKRSKCSN